MEDYMGSIAVNRATKSLHSNQLFPSFRLGERQGLGIESRVVQGRLHAKGL